MKTFKGQLGNYVLFYEEELSIKEYGLYLIRINKDNWFNNLFPNFKISYIDTDKRLSQWTGSYETFVLADEKGKDEMVQDRIKQYENSLEEAEHLIKAEKETDEFLMTM